MLEGEETMFVQPISTIMEAIILGYFKMNTKTSWRCMSQLKCCECSVWYANLFFSFNKNVHYITFMLGLIINTNQFRTDYFNDFWKMKGQTI